MDSGLGGYFDTAIVLQILDQEASLCISERRIAELRGAVGIYQSHKSTAGETYVRKQMTTVALASPFRRLSMDEVCCKPRAVQCSRINSNDVDWRIVYDVSSTLQTPDA